MPKSPAEGHHESSSGPPDSPQSTQLATAYPLVLSSGVLLTAWGIRHDTILVFAGGIKPADITSFKAQPVKVLASYENTTGIDTWQPLTALVLPPGTLPLSQDAYPPIFIHLQEDGDVTLPSWCDYFPFLPGC